MDLISWIVVGGVTGTLIGGFIMEAIGKHGVSGFNLYSFLVALLGAVILLAVAKKIRKSCSCAQPAGPNNAYTKTPESDFSESGVSV